MQALRRALRTSTLTTPLRAYHCPSVRMICPRKLTRMRRARGLFMEAPFATSLTCQRTNNARHLIWLCGGRQSAPHSPIG
jgi:hypothetical protein